MSTLQLDTLDEPLNVLVLDRDDRLREIVAHIGANEPGLVCHGVGRAALLQQLRIEPRHLDLALESVYFGALVEKPPAGNLAPAAITAGFHLQRRKKTLYAASIAVGLAGIAWTGYNLWRAYDFAQEAARAARATTAVAEQYQDITRTFPAAPTSSENLIKTVNIYQQVVQSARSPQPFMQLLSRALEAQPEIYVQEISWHHGAEPLANAGAQPAAAGLNSRRQSGTIAAEVRPFRGDYRAAIASINRLAERLSREPLVADVKIVKLPLNINPEAALAGDTRDAADHAGAAEFQIRVTLKPNT
ncbi:MAG: hypothetical protein FJY56_09130 [Betaproteobacteria bacterium]|nr:hypothetical protein [Betaproteobacteria bacterium]